MEHAIAPLIKGYLCCSSLIMAIGPQNAFVLKQGLQKNHIFITALACATIDSFFILLGVGGLGALFTSNKDLLYYVGWGGALFLLWYGFNSFRASFRGNKRQLADGSLADKPNLKRTILLIMVFSFLNPHLYLDTVVLIGSISVQFCPSERPYFALGAMAASYVWFFGMSYGARFLIPLFKNPKAWQILDFIIGCIMWAIAALLLMNLDRICAV